ncbi:MAG TPA: hypothetical protein VGM56_26420 [Byssovorax sp.]|jgi:hypothetical protein
MSTMARRVLVLLLVVTASMAATRPSVARADESPEVVAARRVVADKRLQAWVLLGLGAALIGLGVPATVAGAAPCPPGQDCSTRPLGVVFGAPLIGAGLILGGASAIRFTAASRADAAIDAGRADKIVRPLGALERDAALAAKRTELTANGYVYELSGLLLLGGGAAFTTLGAGPCAERDKCAAAPFAVGAGVALAAAGGLLVWKGERDRGEGARLVHVAPYAPITSRAFGVAVTASF